MKHIITAIFAIICCTSALAQTGTLEPDSVSTRVSEDIIATAPKDSVTPVQTDIPATGPKVTPVDIDDNKPRVVMHYYDQHGEPLAEPVMFLATLDTVQKAKPKPIYPLYNGINVGVNFADLIFMAFGQRSGSFDVWANVSLFNWFFPTLECGLGYINDTPDNTNFKVKSGPSFYAKLGFNYNFLYKSNPDYQLYLGFRAGFSSFKYDLDNITINSDYWGESQNFSLRGLKSTCIYGEVLLGLQVKIVSNFSLGWSARWHLKFKESEDRGNKPVFIPGYGNTGAFGFSLSAIWTIPSKANTLQ